ncbi:AMP-binding protein [Nocardioides convexus]|uniref:AMP-binding protein n=1 Tax=Nocardioides convexus TaxID=2712224 RepID=UPI0024187838|nr:AMP-binding protein [Nocardioides convexus]
MPLSLVARFRRGLERAPLRPAVRIGTDVLTYEQVHETALRWAASLLAEGTTGPVGVLAGKSPTAYVAPLAVLYAGRTVVPLQPNFPPEVVRRALRVAGVSTLVADAQGLGVLPQVLDASTAGIGLLATDGEHPDLPSVPVLDSAGGTTPAQTLPGDTAYILFTSGSTGIPKGVPVAHGGFAHYFAEPGRPGRLPARGRLRADLRPELRSRHPRHVRRLGIGLDAAGGPTGGVPRPARLPRRARHQRVALHAQRHLDGARDGRPRAGCVRRPALVLLRRRGAEGARRPGLVGRRTALAPGEPVRADGVLDRRVLAPLGRRGVGAGRHQRHSPDRQGARAPRLPARRRRGSGQHRRGRVCGSAAHRLSAGYLDPADDAGRFVEHDGRRWYRTGDRVRASASGDLSLRRPAGRAGQGARLARRVGRGRARGAAVRRRRRRGRGGPRRAARRGAWSCSTPAPPRATWRRTSRRSFRTASCPASTSPWTRCR